MAAPVQSCTKQEMRSDIRLLIAGAKLMEIYTKMLPKYRKPCISKTQVYELIQKYKNEVQIVEEIHDQQTSQIHTKLKTLARSLAINTCLPSYIFAEILPDDNRNCCNM